MLDTIAVHFQIEISPDFLPAWISQRNPTTRGYSLTYRKTVKAQNGCEVKYTYYPRSYTGGPLLKIEFSLPHLIYGDNVYMIYDIPWAIAKANELLPLPPGCPPIDLAEGILRRADLCYNFQAGKLVPYFIRAFQQLRSPYHSTKAYSNTGVMFGNGQASTKFYDKARCYKAKKRAINPAAVGILRFEVTLRKNKVIAWLGKEYPKLSDITNDLVITYLENEQRKLGILGRSIGTYHTTLSKLCEKLGSLVGMKCYSALRAVSDCPTFEDAIVVLNTTEMKLKKLLRKISKEGFVPAIVDAAEDLPALVIDREEVKEMEEKSESDKIYQVILKDMDVVTVSTTEPYHYSKN